MTGTTISAAFMAGLLLPGAGPLFREPVADTTTVRVLGTDAACHTDERAGHPREVSMLAAPSNTCEYFGYYVGGNCVLKSRGGGPGPLQGTYGWDYGGCWFHRNVILHFCWRCKPYQGIGAYNPDQGPHVPNPFALHLRERPEEGCEPIGHGGACAPCGTSGH
jgi:hypothetical protein